MAEVPEKPQTKGQKDLPKVQMVATNFKFFISIARSSKLTIPSTEKNPAREWRKRFGLKIEQRLYSPLFKILKLVQKM